MNPVGSSDLQLVGGIYLGGELPRLLGRPFETQRLVPVSPTAASTATVPAVAGGLGGDAALQGVGVELEDDDALGVPVSGLTTTIPERMGLGMSA